MAQRQISKFWICRRRGRWWRRLIITDPTFENVWGIFFLFVYSLAPCRSAQTDNKGRRVNDQVDYSLTWENSRPQSDSRRRFLFISLLVTWSAPFWLAEIGKYLNFIWFIASPSFAKFARKKKANKSKCNGRVGKSHAIYRTCWNAGGVSRWHRFPTIFSTFRESPTSVDFPWGPRTDRPESAKSTKICSFEYSSPAEVLCLLLKFKIPGPTWSSACVRRLVVTWLQVPPFGTWHCISCKQQFQIRLDVSWAAV